MKLFKTIAIGLTMLAIATILLYLFPNKKKREYQLEIVGEHLIKMYDGDRLVSQFPYNEDEANPTYLDTAILLDNQ